MATRQEIEQLLIQVKNKEEIDQLSFKIEKAHEQLSTLRAELNSGIISPGQFQAQAQPVANNIINMQQRIDTLNKSVGMNRHAWMQMAYALQDITSVGRNFSMMVMAVSNNIQMMAVNAGLGTKGIMGITVAIAGLQMIAYNWENIKKLFNMEEETKTVEQLKKELEELEKKPHKVAVDYMDIENLKKAIKEASEAQEHLNKLRGAPTLEQKEAAETTTKALEESLGAKGERITGPEVAKRLLASFLQPEQFAKTYGPLQDAIARQQENIEEIARLEELGAKAIKEGHMEIAEGYSEDIKVLKANKVALDEAVIQARQMLPREAAIKLNQILRDAQTAGPQQMAAMKQLAEIAGKARNNELLWLKEELEQNTEAAIKERQAQGTVEQNRLQRIKTNRDLNMHLFKVQEDMTKETIENMAPRVQAAIRKITTEFDFKKIATDMQNELQKQGFEQDEIFSRIKEKIFQELMSRLHKMNRMFGPTIAGQAAAQAAQQLATQTPEMARQAAIDQMLRGPVARQVKEEKGFAQATGLDQLAQTQLATMLGRARQQGPVTQQTQDAIFNQVLNNMLRSLRVAGPPRLPGESMANWKKRMEDVAMMITAGAFDMIKPLLAQKVAMNPAIAPADMFLGQPIGPVGQGMIGAGFQQAGAQGFGDIGGQAFGQWMQNGMNNKPGGGFPSIAPVAPDNGAALNQTIQTQDLMKQTNVSILNLAQRLAMSEANLQFLNSQLGMIARAASEHGPTGLRNGAMTT